MKKCRPHNWKMPPQVGDKGLTCRDCGRFLDFAKIPQNKMSLILAGLYKRYPDKEPEIREAMIDAACARVEEYRRDLMKARQ